MNKEISYELVEFTTRVNPLVGCKYYFYYKEYCFDITFNENGIYVVHSFKKFLNECNGEFLFENIITPIFIFKEYGVGFGQVKTIFRNCVVMVNSDVIPTICRYSYGMENDSKTIFERCVL